MEDQVKDIDLKMLKRTAEVSDDFEVNRLAYMPLYVGHHLAYLIICTHHRL